MIATCNKCKRDIEIIQEDIETVELEDLRIDYFSCPYCLRKYVVFAADKKMQELVKERKIIEGQLLLARAKRFTAKTIRGYIDKQEKIKAEQLALMAKLWPRAAKMLREADNGNADRNV